MANSLQANPAQRENGGPAGPRPGLWQGRAAVLLGIVLMGISLRYAVTGLSPLLSDLRTALGISTAGATLIGMLPTLCFGSAGFLAPTLARRIGPESTALLAVLLAAVGSLIRPYVDSPALFMVLTVVALVGMGFGNVIGAPLVKKYFPDRQASMVTVFALLMQAGATLPTILQQYSGLDRAGAGLAFSIYTFMTLPMAVVTPLIANKLQNPIPLAVLLAAAGPVGYIGIVLGIGPPWFMTLIAGLAGGAFPLAIAMFNLRSRTTMGSAAIGGFAMGIGYLAGTLGPLLGGWLYATTGSWAMALWVYAATLVPMAIGGMMMAKPDPYLEDTLKQ